MEFQSPETQTRERKPPKQNALDSEDPCRGLTVRRNPPRRAKHTPAATHPPPDPSAPSLTSGASPAAKRAISAFPIGDILQSEPPPVPPSLLKSSDPNAGTSENLRVFLRIRPLEVKARAGRNTAGVNGRSRAKAMSLKGDERCRSKKKNAVCLVVNDSNSVTLAAPSFPLDSKRGKSEVYDGFSFVFPSDSSQKEVYERVMDPLVRSFMEGESGLLAALGPTGSGKTHTMFGCPREPGIVPLVLKQIFIWEKVVGEPKPARPYYLSMFEIYSERGKGERIFDLSSDGVDLSLQQSSSTIKGLQETMVSNVAEAECLIARGMLKRATAVTNANDHSSRSQCIINIRSGHKNIHDENETLHGPVLTIVDLAGAERERRTGNQGARLLESNFINNTSMVFGLCLRSLLEHQKNPKRPLQKHFHNSLLTRHLRDYLEGKKRFTLILTVKPGEDDYLDSSLLLRQASPYMKIKFSNGEGPQVAPSQKRFTVSLTRTKQSKRRKCNGASLVDAIKSGKDEHPFSGIDVNIEQPQLEPSKISVQTPQPNEKMYQETLLEELKRLKRNDQVMQDFSKALWNVLKQYKQKLEVSENDVKILQRSLRGGELRCVELEKELEELRSHCSCCKHHPVEVASWPVVDIRSEHCATGLPLIPVTGNNSANVEEADDDNYMPSLQNFNVVDSSFFVQDIGRHNKHIDQTPENFIRRKMVNLGAVEISSDENFTETGDAPLDPFVSYCQSHIMVKGNELKLHLSVETASEIEDKKPINQTLVSCTGRRMISMQVKEISSDAKLTETDDTPSDPVVSSCQTQISVGDSEHILPSSVETTLEMEDGKSFLKAHAFQVEDVGHTDGCQVGKLPREEKGSDFASKILIIAKPRRKLLPASAMLLKEFNGFDLEVEKSKGNRVTVKRERSQGSISLFHLIRSNSHQ